MMSLCGCMVRLYIHFEKQTTKFLCSPLSALFTRHFEAVFSAERKLPFPLGEGRKGWRQTREHEHSLLCKYNNEVEKKSGKKLDLQFREKKWMVVVVTRRASHAQCNWTQNAKFNQKEGRGGKEHKTGMNCTHSLTSGDSPRECCTVAVVPE